MNIIIENIKIAIKQFNSFSEAKAFAKYEPDATLVLLEETYGENSFVVQLRHSLTDKQILATLFSADKPIDKLTLLIWNEASMFVLEADDKLYLISTVGKIINTVNLNTPLVGLYISKSKLLVLEEASFKTVNQKGEVVREHLFDLIENFYLNNDVLEIVTMDEEEYLFDLST